MVFWKKDALTKSDEASDRIGRYTEALGRSAITKHNPTEALVLLAGAAGSQAAALFLEHRGSVAMEELIKAGCDTLRNNGYLRAGLIPPNLSVASSPPQNEGKNLTEEQFKELSLHIVDEATKNNTPADDAIAATAKAIGVMISILSERPGFSAEDLIKVSQTAVAEFAREALAYRASLRRP